MSGAIGEGTSWLSSWQSLENALIFPAREGPGPEQLDAAPMRQPQLTATPEPGCLPPSAPWPHG